MRLSCDFEHLGVAGTATWEDGKWSTDNEDLEQCIKAATAVGVFTACSPTGPWVKQGTKTLEQFYCTVRDWVDRGTFYATATGYANPSAPPTDDDGGPTLLLETLGQRLARRTSAAMR